MRDCIMCEKPLTYPYINHPGPVHEGACHQALTERDWRECIDCGTRSFAVAANAKTWHNPSERCTPCYMRVNKLHLCLITSH